MLLRQRNEREPACLYLGSVIALCPVLVCFLALSRLSMGLYCHDGAILRIDPQSHHKLPICFGKQYGLEIYLEPLNVVHHLRIVLLDPPAPIRASRARAPQNIPRTNFDSQYSSAIQHAKVPLANFKFHPPPLITHELL